MGLIIGSQQSQRPSSEGAVRYDKPQSLTASQKETAQMNIGVQKIAELIINDLVSGGTDKVLSAEMGKYLKQLIDALSLGKFYGFFDSADDLPTGSIAGYAYVGSENPYTIYNFNGTWSDSGTTIDNATEVVNNLDDGGVAKALSAEMGKYLADILQIDSIVSETRVDFDAGKRNVLFATGEFVDTTTADHYANEIALDGDETNIKWYSWPSIQSGYAFLDNNNNVISGAAGQLGWMEVNPQTAIAQGATKVRIAVNTSTGVQTITVTKQGSSLITDVEYIKNIIGGSTPQKVYIDRSALRNVNYLTGEFVSSTQAGHYANEIALDGDETEIIRYANWGFQGDNGYAFLDDNNNVISGAKDETAYVGESSISCVTPIAQGATKLRISLRLEAATPDYFEVKKSGNVIEQLQTAIDNTNDRIDELNGLIGGPVREDIPVDIDSGLRNVSSETGEFVITSSTGHYANEIALKGNEISISFFTFKFSGNYGYAFLDDDDNLILGVKTTINEWTTVDCVTPIAQGATKFRFSFNTAETTIRIIPIVRDTTKIAQIQDDITNIKSELAQKADGSKYGFVGSAMPYIADYDTAELTTFNTVTDIYDAFDALVTQYPLWMKKETDMGLDESGTYTMRHYSLRMQNPLITADRTGTGANLWSDTTYKPKHIIVNMSIHSTEKYAVYGAYLAIKNILESNDNWALFIKSNFVIDIIPCYNPWGLMHNSSNNVNNVNLNRDFVNKSQQETKNMVALMASLMNDGLIGVIDCHNTGDSTNGYFVSKPVYKYYNFYARLAQQLNALMLPLTNQIFGTTRANHFHLWNATDPGQLHEYCNKLGILGCTIEASSTVIGSELMTKTLVINLIQTFGTF